MCSEKSANLSLGMSKIMPFLNIFNYTKSQATIKLVIIDLYGKRGHVLVEFKARSDNFLQCIGS